MGPKPRCLGKKDIRFLPCLPDIMLPFCYSLAQIVASYSNAYLHYARRPLFMTSMKNNFWDSKMILCYFLFLDDWQWLSAAGLSSWLRSRRTGSWGMSAWSINEVCHGHRTGRRHSTCRVYLLSLSSTVLISAWFICWSLPYLYSFSTLCAHLILLPLRWYSCSK